MKTLLLFLLLPVICFGQDQLGQDIDGEAALDFSGFSTSLSADGTILAVGAPFNDGNGNAAGHVRVFEFVDNVWQQLGEDIDGLVPMDNFGRSVSLSDDGAILAIGTFSSDENGTDAGQTRIFENQNGSWVQIGQTINGEAVGDNSGTSVSISSNGTVVAIGETGNDGDGSGVNFGQVRVFQFQNGIWMKIGQDIIGEAELDFSGSSVSLSSNGGIVAIGASGNAGVNGFRSGQVRIYELQSGTWVQVGQDIDGEAEFDFFGVSTSLSAEGDVVAIRSGANDGNGDNSGSTRVFENIEGIWTQIGQDIDGEAVDDGEFPTRTNLSLSDDGTILAIGANRNDGNGPESGHVRVYQNIDGNWTQIVDDIDGEAPGDQSGYSVSLSADGTILAIGARDNAANGEDSGQVRVFDIGSFIVLGTEDFASANFTMYPNPASTEVLIKLNDNSILKSVTIYNALGQPVITRKDLTINTSGLSTGVYVVEIITTTGKSSQKLIIR